MGRAFLFMPLVQCTQEQEEEAVAAVLCTRGKTGQEIAEEYRVSRPALYKWRKGLFITALLLTLGSHRLNVLKGDIKLDFQRVVPIDIDGLDKLG